ncbi:MAG TPA: hypothetical protein VK147_06605 [Candidatus Didemnitutus sp.]|nr:hypothetical protein [Candidatus Didemnitutus sp.]
MASDDEPMKVSIQPRSSYILTWQYFVFILTMAVGNAAIVLGVHHLTMLDPSSAKNPMFLTMFLVSTSALVGPRLKSISTFLSMVGLHLLAGLVCYTIVQVMFIALGDVEPWFLSRFLIYLPVAPLLIFALPYILSRLYNDISVTRSTLKPLAIVSGLIVMAGILASGDWIFEVLTQASR